MAVETQISRHNPLVARFIFTDRSWVAETTQVVRGLDDPFALAPRIITAIRSRAGKGAKPNSAAEIRITAAIQAAIDEFLG